MIPGSAANTAVLMATFNQLARGLVLPAAAAGAPPTEAGTTSYRALRATLEGDSALVLWSLQAARNRYREAFTIDPAFMAPRLRYARASLWADEPIDEWRDVAGTVLTDTTQLGPAEILEARALVGLADGDFPLACAHYRSLLRADSLQFGAWFGLGECLTRDSTVVEDSVSPSGWRFRGSYAEGIAAYRRALTLVPLAHVAYGGAALGRLAERLKAQSNALRWCQCWRRTAAGSRPSPASRATPLASCRIPLKKSWLASTSGARVPTPWLRTGRHCWPSPRSGWHAIRRARVALGSQALSLELAGYAAAPGPGGRSALNLVREIRQAQTGDDRNDLSRGLGSSPAAQGAALQQRAPGG